MKERFILFRRGGVFYSEDTTTRKQISLRTKDETEALTLLRAKNESTHQPILNLQLARVYLTASDPAYAQRTLQHVMDQMQANGKPATRIRCARAMTSKAFEPIRRTTLMETMSEQFLAILNGGKLSVIHYLRRLHNLALSLGWLSIPVLAPRLWPKPQYKAKRGITLAEHQQILAADKNAERNLFYQILLEIGSSKSDAAALTHENIDWASNTLTFFRMKNGEQAQMSIGSTLAALLKKLLTTGPLFPKIAATSYNARSSEFSLGCGLLNIEGVSLHSYRYAWAKRAKTCGYPERFAQAALGHNSKAAHRACAKNAQVVIPTLEEFESVLHTSKLSFRGKRSEFSAVAVP